MEKKKREITVYHVELKEPREGERKHIYFGSLAAVFDTYSRDRLGVSYRGINNNYNLRKEVVYENKHCIIRSGILQTKKQSSKQNSNDRE